MKTTKHPTLVQFGCNGDRLEVRGKTDAGVETDAGLIPWDSVLAFWVWHKPTGQYLSIPLDDR